MMTDVFSGDKQRLPNRREAVGGPPTLSLLGSTYLEVDHERFRLGPVLTSTSLSLSADPRLSKCQSAQSKPQRPRAGEGCDMCSRSSIRFDGVY